MCLSWKVALMQWPIKNDAVQRKKCLNRFFSVFYLPMVNNPGRIEMHEYGRTRLIWTKTWFDSLISFSSVQMGQLVWRDYIHLGDDKAFWLNHKRKGSKKYRAYGMHRRCLTKLLIELKHKTSISIAFPNSKKFIPSAQAYNRDPE